MADRYWVGGTANWDGTAGTKWATTSGGPGGASVPTSADDVYFDGASGAVTITAQTATPVCRNFNATGFTGTFVLSGVNFVPSGSVTFSAGMTFTPSGNSIITNAGSGSFTFTTAGKTMPPVFFDGVSPFTATYTLQDAFTSSGAITVTRGTFDTGNYNVTATALNSSNSNTRTINLGSSTVTLSSNSPIGFLTNTNLTFNAGTSSIVCSATSSTIQAGPVSATGVTFYNVSLTSVFTGIHQIQSINTFNNLAVTGPSAAGVIQVRFNSRQTVNGTFSTSGTAGNRRVWFQGTTYGIAQTLTINSAPSLTDADFRDLYVVGTAAPISGTRIGNLRGCRGITFSTPKTVYWNKAAGGNWSDDAWAASSGAGVSTDNFPLAQDTAVIENTGLNTSATITLDTAISYVGTITMSTRTNAMTLNAVASPIIYGNFVCGSGTTYTHNLGTQTYSGRNTQTITSAGKTLGDITVDSYGGSLELADALNIGTRTLTVTNGTFDTKNFNVTASALSSSNSNVRTITLGSSTLTLSGASPVSFTTFVNLSLSAGTSSIVCSASTSNFNGGNCNFYDVSFTGAGSGVRSVLGLNTFNNLSIGATSSEGISEAVFSANQTITGTLTVAGATAVRRIFVRSDTLGTTRTLTVGTLSATDCDFRDITIAGAAAGSSPTRAGDCGGNSGITFPAPKTVYWNLAGTQNWSATGWAPGTGGTPDINNFPLAQDTAVFDNTGSAGTVTVDAAWNIGTFDASLRTSAMTFTIVSVNIFVYGDWKFGTGVTSSVGSGLLNFAKRGIQTITSNGVTFGRDITVDCVTGTVQLADALVLTSGRTLTLTSGTFDAVTYNVTTGLFSALSAVAGTVWKMGSGTWTLSGVGVVLGGVSSNVTFYKGTANITLSNTSSSTRSFAGGGLSFNKLTIGGTTGTSTLLISGNNQFTELASTKTVAHTIDLGSTTQTFGKWTVTGTAGNVVTLTGTGTSHILAGACTSGIDYLAMGSIGFAATSPGEFYAGANSTGTAGAPVYRTAKPADSTRYWVGGTGNWSDTARWSTGSGGLSGASVPRSHDDVVFDSASNATAYTATVNAVTGGIRMKSLTIAGPASGNVTLAGSAAMVGIHGNVTLPATGLTRTYTGDMTLSSNSTGLTFTTNGVVLNSNITVNGVDSSWTLGSALDMGAATLAVFSGSLAFSTYNVTTGVISSNVQHSRTINFGSSTVSISSSNVVLFGITEQNRANLTVTSGTSQINASNPSPIFAGNNQTFYNVSFTSTSAGTVTISGVNSFNNLSFTGITAAGLKIIDLSANQTITGTLTLSAGTNATMRHFVRSNTLGTTRTLTVAAFSGTDVDFRDITIAGAAAPVSGTRLGDAKGNSGITFPSPKTVYVRSTGSANWSSSTGWSATSGGAADVTQFPLAQDTAVFPAATYPASGSTITIDQDYNIGTIDMSLRTTNTVTLTTAAAVGVYGNWINGTGTTLSGSTSLRFFGRGSQTITSAGKTFTQFFDVNSPGGTLTLQDAFTCSTNGATAFVFNSGTLDANSFNFTLSGSTSAFNSSNSNIRTIAIGSGTWTLAGSSVPWTTSTSTNLTVTGTGTIKLTSSSAKDFFGGGVAYTNITLDQGGAGTMGITGNNTFKDITNSYKATGATAITFGTTTQRVSQFTAAGEAGRILTIQGTSASSPGTLVLTGGTDPNLDYLTITGLRAYNLEDTWYAGANSTNNGSLGFYFESGTPAGGGGGNFFLVFG